MIVDINGLPGFLPGSQIDVRPIKDFDNYLDKDDAERYRAIRDEGLFDIGLSARFFNSLVKQYEQSIEDIMPLASAQLPDHVIEEMPIYIGKDSLAKNIELVEQVSQTYQNRENINVFDHDN